MKRQFRVCVQLDERTRFLCDDRQLCESLACMARAILDTWTAGPRPEIIVTLIQAEEHPVAKEE